VSHLDVFSTILDYVGASELDESDGTSLRPMIENHVINVDRDQDVAFGEWDFRMPTSPGSDTLTRELDNRPTNLVRKGPYKLMIHKSSASEELDMMFDLSKDPFELNNLVGKKGMTADDQTVSKAEHMRCLLLEWMIRLDGDGENRYFSDPANNYFEGDGDIVEVGRRQSWRQIGFWVSDTVLKFGRVALDDDNRYVRHEWIYMGTRMEETISVTSISVMGSDASYFEVDRDFARIDFGDCIPIRVSLTSQFVISSNDNEQVDAYLVISAEGRATKFVRLQIGSSGRDDDDGDESESRPIIRPPPSDVTPRTDPPLAQSQAPQPQVSFTSVPTMKPIGEQEQASAAASSSGSTRDDLVLVCHMCPSTLCLQRPNDIYPMEGIKIKCQDIELGGKHLLTPIPIESCESLQNEMSSGVCGGCGTQGC
jgi:hypothetical protein